MLKPRPGLGFAVVVACLTPTACRDPADSSAGVVVRDSAGIRIVRNLQPESPAGWTLDPQPLVVIGGDERDSTQQLFRVSDATRLDDGRIVIANAGNRQLRMYDRRGHFVRAIGRAGAGPGELSRFLGSVWHFAGDSIGVFDEDAGRVIVFDSSGVFVRSIAFDRPLNQVERMLDGTFAGYTATVDDRNRASGDVWWSESKYLRYSADGGLLNEVGIFRGTEYTASEWEGSLLRARRPMGRVAVTAPGRMSPPHGATKRSVEVLYHGDSDSYRITALSLEGRPLQIVERTGRERSLTAEMREAYIAERLLAAPDPRLRDLWRTNLEATRFPETVPAYSQLEVDPAGDLWVREWDLPGATEVAWSIFSPEGRWLTDLRVPQRLEVLETASDYIIALGRDDLDVERVEVLRISRP